MTAPEQPVKQEEMAALDADYLQAQHSDGADKTTDLTSIQLTGASERWEVLTPAAAVKEEPGVVHVPNAGIVTSNGQYVLPLQSLQTQPVFVTSGTDVTAGTLPNIQYQVIPQVHTLDGQMGFSTTPVEGSEAGQIHILPDTGHNLSVSASSDLLTNTQNLVSQPGQISQDPGVSVAGSTYSNQGQVVSTVPVGLPSNITFVPISSLDLDSLGLSSAQTIATGVTPDGQLIMAGQAAEGSECADKTQGHHASNSSTNQDVYIPTSSSQLPETIDGTGVLTQATAVSQASQLSYLPQTQAQQGATAPATLQDGETPGMTQTVQNLQLLNPGTFLIQAQTLTPSGQIQWQTFQVQNLPLSAGGTQQITLAPVQTVSLQQGVSLGSSSVSLGSTQMPSLQTVTVNSSQTAVQFHPADSTASPGDIQIKEEPDAEEWQLSGDSTLNPNDLSHLRVRLVEDEMEPLGVKANVCGGWPAPAPTARSLAAEGPALGKRSSTCATCQAVGRFTERRLT
ncbi:hypothetical protein GJAV_G00208430 [Gymnothorax javanicus]|nr:hypothetical protein GJAV_G00208430 [Gymnothorax javanicus]